MNNKLDIMIEYQFYLISTVLANEPVKEMLFLYLLVSTRAVIVLILLQNCFVIYRQLFWTFIASKNLKHIWYSKLCIKAC